MGNERVIEKIRECRDVAKLRIWKENAQRHGADDVERAAFAQLVSVMPEAASGTLDHALWQTVHTIEEMRREERGKSSPMHRTRPKIKRVGVKQTLIDWALGPKETDEFSILLDRGMLHLAGEAIVLRFPDQFEPNVLAAARSRFEKKGMTVAEIQALIDWRG
ncbi:hypothetical protein [Maricaulis sp.]|uniref:hypothetical protein n=1 Tax=Maricaulis sp. TaxID=1486257 RepID=UPI003A958A25